jgi:hypothetical protein
MQACSGPEPQVYGFRFFFRGKEGHVSFEQQPLLLIVVVVLTIEGWSLCKTAVRAAWQRRKRTAVQR